MEWEKIFFRANTLVAGTQGKLLVVRVIRVVAIITKVISFLSCLNLKNIMKNVFYFIHQIKG